MPQRHAELIDMPMELCERIAYLLDLGTVLSLRCTCKYLLSVTNSWRLWTTFTQEMMSNPHLFIHKESLEHYTVQELTDWVLRRHGAQKLLRSSLPAKFLERRVPGSCFGSQVKLLPGGRWLLFTNGPNIFFVDCDAETLEPQLLISTQGPPEDNYLRFITWSDRDVEQFSLRVALIHWEEIGWLFNSRQFWVTFYDVSLIGRGPNARLTSKLLSNGKQYRGNTTSDYHFEGLNNHDFILLGANSGGDAFFASPIIYHISDYADPLSPEALHTVMLTGTSVLTKGLYILPENRFAVVGWSNKITIYPIPTAKTDSIAPLHCIETDYRLSFSSERLNYQSSLCVGETSTTMVYKDVVERKVLYRVISIPHQDHEEPTVQFITSYPPPKNKHLVFVGIRSTIFLLYREEDGLNLQIANHSWSDLARTEGEICTKEFGISDLFGTEIQDFNEEIGRVVIHADWGVASSNTFLLDVIKA